MGVANPPRLRRRRRGGGCGHVLCALILSIPLLSIVVDSRLYSASAQQFSKDGTSEASLSDHDFVADPAMKDMTFDIGYGPQEFRTYVQPDVSEFYREEPGTRAAKKPMHTGWAAKFVNMSTRTVRLYWDPRDGSPGSPMSVMKPFNSAGTASFPSHAFYMTPDNDPNTRLAHFVMKPPQAVYYYDPITVEGDEEATQRNLDALTNEEFEAYQEHVASRTFGKQYFEFTGREYLSLYPRNAPSHKFWRADYFGQEHWVTTPETHFTEMPPDDKIGGRIKEVGAARILKPDEPRLLSEYRNPGALNLTLKVLSCAPRAFQIDNFLSPTEVDHIMYKATGMTLHRSTTAGDTVRDPDAHDSQRKTRTSQNTWVYREEDAIIDAIYRRAADLLRIDEALLRPRSEGEYPHLSSTKSLAEALQLVHYDVGQEYTAHHDFGYADFKRKDQPARFATLLLYLNEPEQGGETQFPRWVNAETRDGLDVPPEIGKAVLFYSQLPDGNMDDWSHHAALPVKKGEKWLINLWVWDPEYT